MKKLTAIRLINWHAFSDETIKIHNSALLSGENGAGKSTILDAMQFVMTCSKNNFNKAANENSKRSLLGYVRYKTGREDKEYERTGNITSNVALEFYEESKKNYFVVGAVVDSASENSEKVMWYKFEKCKINDILFVEDEKPLDISGFKVAGQKNKIQNYNRQIDAKNAFLARFGRLNQKFFELLPKSLAFKPISNVKDFVFTYILEEKDVNVDALRENIRTFREFEDLLNDYKIKLSELENIEENYRIYEEQTKVIKLHEYIVLLAEIEEYKEKIKLVQENIEKMNIKLETENNNKQLLRQQINLKRDYYNKLQAQLLSDSSYVALNDAKKELTHFESQFKEKKNSRDKFFELVKQNRKKLKDLSELVKEEYINEFINEIANLNKDNVEEFKISSKPFENYLQGLNDKARSKKAENEYKLTNQINERKNLENKISELEKKNLQYSPQVLKLRDGIIRETKKLGKVIEPKILCELLEINDETWRNAVEGYLNTQRFYFLVEKEDFDTVIKIYERLIKTERIHSVGIINTSGLEKYDTLLEEGSLAEMVTAKSKDAQRYINKVLGRVIRVNKAEELKKYSISITKTCMLYKSNVARAINPDVYKTPYIGADAYKEQLRQAKEELIKLNEDISVVEGMIELERRIIKILDNLKITEIRDRADILIKTAALEDQIVEIKQQIEKLKENSSFMEIQIQSDEVKAEINKLEKSINAIDDNLIHINSSIQSNTEKNNQFNQKLSIKNNEKENYINIGSIKEEAESRLEKESKLKSYEIIKNNFSMSKTKYITMRNDIDRKISSMQSDYKHKYNFNAQVGIEGISAYIDELADIKKSKIIEYEEKVKDARKKSEEEFKEHFISRIQENIITAKEEFKFLNKGLKGIDFGDEQYVFKCGKSKQNKDYYDMIMDEENIGEGVTLFSAAFEENHKELLNELFEKLTLDDEGNEEELRKLTDYRNYMSYDIEIKYKSGSTALFSKVCKEKSGGETQTPFYVAMAASFLQLYNKDSIGLILFDEAFDKMDEARIMSMMEFYNKLNLQIIIAAPPQKIESITPYVGTVLLAIKSGNESFIEEMINEKL